MARQQVPPMAEDSEEDGDYTEVDRTFEAMEAESEMLNDPAVEHLPPPPEVGPYVNHERDVFDGPGEWGGHGRSVSPRLLSHAAAFPGCEQLRVWRVDEGRPLGLGTIGRDASEEELVAKFGQAMLDRSGNPKGGRFLIRPVDGEGRYLGQEFRINIDQYHESLQGYTGTRVKESNGTNAGSEVMALLHTLLSQQQQDKVEERRRDHEQKVEERRRDHERTESLLREREEMAAERVALASNAATGVQSVAERMMGQEVARQAEVSTMIQGIFSQTIAQTTAAADRERERAEAALQRQREEARIAAEQQRIRWEQERERDRQWLEERRLAMDRDRDERNEDADRRERQREHAAELSMQRERDHAERMAGLQLKSGLGGLEGILKTFGSSPRDALDWFRENMSGKNESEGIGPALIKGATEVAKSLGEAASQQAQVQSQAREMEDEEAVLMQQQLMQQQMAQQRQLAGPQQNPAQGQQRGPLVTPPPAPQAPHPAAGLPLPVQRKARKAIASLVARLRAEPEPQWEGVITLGVLQNPAVIEYIKATTVRGAVMEGGADAAFAAKIVQAIDSSGLVPPTIPRG